MKIYTKAELRAMRKTPEIVATIEVGEYAEHDPWEIRSNEILTVTGREPTYTRRPGFFCDHIAVITPAVNINDESMPEFAIGILPYAVIASNEGGYNSTIVCLQCILREANNRGIR